MDHTNSSINEKEMDNQEDLQQNNSYLNSNSGSESMNFRKYENRIEHGLVERIYDAGQGEKFNDLIKNPTKIKAMKAFITGDDDIVTLPDEKTTKSRFDEGKLTGHRTSNNIQDLLSITGFKVIDKLPPTGGETITSANQMIDRFRVSATDFSNNSQMNVTKTRFNVPLEPKLSRPTTTIINLGKAYSQRAKNERNAERENELEREALLEAERQQKLKENPLEELHKEIDESDQDEYMNKIHKFIRDAFENRDHKMDFVYYLPSDKENYYELRPKEFKDISKEKTYYTLSSKGLTVYIDKKPKEFIKLAEWINERQRYNVIAEIPFFKNFKIWRIIKMWRKNIFKQKKIAYQNELQNALLFNNNNYNDRLIRHKSYCNSILTLKIVDMKVGLDSNSFQKFQDLQNELRRRNRKKLDDVHDACQNNFDTSLRTIFSQVQQKINDLHNEENRNTDDNKKGNKLTSKKKKKEERNNDYENYEKAVNDQKGILNEDEIVGFDNFSYKNKMMIKDECKNFVKLAYLFDYIMLDVLRRMFIFSMTDVLTKLDEYNEIGVPPKKENMLNKNGEYIKPQIQNPNRVVPYFLIQCKLDNKPIEKLDYQTVKVKPFFVKATPDSDFDPSAHIQIDNEEKEYQRLLNEGKTPQDIMNSGVTTVQNVDSIEVKEIKRPHHYFISYDPDYEHLKTKFEKEINETLGELKVKGWRAHPRFSHYLKYMDDWDEKFGEWDTDEPRDLNVELILKEDAVFIQKESDIAQKLRLAYNKCETYLERLDPYLQYHWKQKSINKEILLDEYLKDADEMFRLIFVFSEKSKKIIERYIPYDEEIGMIKLTLEEGLRKDLRLAQNSTIDFLKENYPDKLKARTYEIESWFDDMLKKLEGDILDEQGFLQKTKAKEILDIWYDINERKLNTLLSIAQLLKSKNFERIGAEDVKLIENINVKKFQLKVSWDALTENLRKSQDKLLKNLKDRSIPNLFKETGRIEEPLKDPKFINYDPTVDDIGIIGQNLDKLEELDKNFVKIEKDAATYNQFLTVLGYGEENFSKVEDVREMMNILQNLWKALNTFGEDCEKWKKTQFSELDTKQILEKCEEYEIIGRRAASNFGDDGTAIKTLINTVNSFAESMKVVDYLKCKDLNKNHWDRIQNLFPEETFLLITQSYTLEQLLSIEAYKYEKEIRTIQLEAINFRQLEDKINIILEMKKEIILSPNMDKKMFENFGDMINALEECQMRINNVVSSKYAKLFLKMGEKNPYKLKQDFEAYLNAIDFLKLFQKKYKYLENIINSGDMKRKLQDSTFDKVDIEWKTALNKSAGFPISKILDMRIRMTPCAKLLDQIQQKIEEQLKAMRNYFERFYFISNDDLLFMLANAKSNESRSGKDGIEMIKPYLCKIFEDIYDLKYAAKVEGTTSKYINGIVSLSKEEFMLMKDYKEKKVKIEDDLEKWLEELEKNINECLKEKMTYAYKYFVDVKEENRHKQWLEKIIDDKDGKQEKEKESPNISQTIATISHVKFCENTELAIRELPKEQSSLMDWYQKIDKAILSYSKMVNEDFANNNPNLRRIISNLITHYVHYKDIMRELVEVEPGIDDFEWQKQLRAYMEGAEPGRMDEKNLVVRIRQLKYQFDYGYEYFGPSTRIVISPLTDRVWLTMSSALQIKLGCSLGGPAGTGKTETTKDLAKFFGIQCIVFNCSEQIDYKILGNIFSGLCKHKFGAYACLDEFNRINVEVLSVIATQLFKIRQAQLIGAKTVTIMTDAITLVGKSGVFITMNPTYSGRSELPDNLKANFRPITMMKPEFSKIAQVKLYSEGFSESDALSKKLYKLYELAEQQLSQQDHYDFTLRTLGTVLSMAGNLKRKTKSEFGKEKHDEDLIVLSALRDANFPKFISEDIKLFRALLSDLFPDIELTEPVVEFFDQELTKVIEENTLDPSPFTMKKCLQLVDIVNIRLGVCLTGPPGTGKSTCIDLVQKVCTKIRTENPNCDPRYKLIKKWVINPKSITMGELFGEENEEKKIFEYGICTKKIKKALLDEGDDKFRWVVLDGPIDTKWIENMNSVLDDSQTLCLANGERIKLKSHVKVLFEVEDLSKASLATVSRLGVIYLGPKELGWRPYAHHWMKVFFTDEKILPKELQLYVEQLFEDKVDDAVDNIDDLYLTGCCFIKPSISSMIASLCYFLEFYFTREHGFIGREWVGLDNQDQLGRYKKKIIMCFALAMVWGVFGCVNNKGSARVESFIRNKFGEIKLENSQLIMEHFYDFQRDDYIRFSTESAQFQFVKGMAFASIFVPTIDTLRYSFVLDILLNARKNIYVTGETGTGKTAIIEHINRKLLETEEWTFINMNFSAQTSSKEIQEGLEKKLEQEKGKKRLWGKGGKKCLVFIDDINMPEPNEWGAHPPIELLRQFLDRGGWYDRPQFFWKYISNTNMIVAGGPPIGGRSLLTGRFTRHFTLVCFPQPNKQVLNYIFENILRGFFTTNAFSEEVKKYTIETTSSTIELYEIMLNIMKPIPSKFHYIFNLRDISRVFQGILMVKASHVSQAEVYIKLWMHEVQRVFCDRLINEADLKIVRENICQLLRNKFKTNWTYDQLFKTGPPIYFSELQKGPIPDRPYDYVQDLNVLNKRLNEFLSIYNSKNKTNPLNIVFFDYFIAHLIRVCRILRQPRGNMVLIGHGGSGKQTVCQLSSFIMTGFSDRFHTFSAPRDFKLEEFKKIIKDIIKKANFYHVTLLLNDNNVGHNFILENINNLLNNGEIPGLLENDYGTPIGNLQPDINLTYEQFVENSRNKFHLLFCTSPVGDNLRMRVRKFPALINCCMLDWFMAWPQEALISCAERAFKNIPYEKDKKSALVKLVVEAHSCIEELRDKFFNEFGRKVYITPKSFLDMNDMLINLLDEKKKQNDERVNVLKEGTDKLAKTHTEIIHLEEEIRKLEPKIAETEKFLEEKVRVIKIKKEELTKQQSKVNEVFIQSKGKKKEVEQLLNKINSERDACQRKFEGIKEQVKEKLSSDTLSLFAKEKATSELKIIVPEALAYFLKGKHTNSSEKSYAYQVFEEKNTIYKIEEMLRKNSIPDHVFEEFKKYLNEKVPKVFEKYHPELSETEDKLGKLSETHQTLYIWGKGVVELWEIDKELRPLKEEAKQKKEELDKLDAQLSALNETQKKMKEELQQLEDDKNKSQEEIDQLQTDKKINTDRKNNASKLTTLLKDEGIRWDEQLTQLNANEGNFLGNIIISSLFISYFSPFSGSYRKDAQSSIMDLCRKYNIPFSRNYSLDTIMSDPVEIRQWTMKGLPNDAVSIENAIMFNINQKYPLFIDPQLQGNQWLKNMYKGKLIIYKADCKEENLKAQFEGIGNDLIQGNLTLLENVGETLDTVYSPIVNQSTFTDDSGLLKIRFNGNDKEFSTTFKMFFTTKLANPHYPPEFYIKLNIINFTVTQSGLSEQLLSEVFKCERREKYEQRDKIIADMGRMNDQLAEFSKDILKKLAEIPQDKILDAVELIETLEEEQVVSNEVNINMKNNIIIEKETNALRNEYVPVAQRGSILFFVVADMCKIDPMYQFSLEYFKKIFINSIMYKEENSPNTKERVKFLERKITEDIYKNIKRGIFESHKTIFSFLIDVNIRKDKGEITDEEFSFFVKGPPQFDTSEYPENPDPKYFSEFQWNSLLYSEQKFKLEGLSKVTCDKVNNLRETIGKIDDLKESFDNVMKDLLSGVKGMDEIYKKNFMKLIIMKIYRPEKLLYFVKKIVGDDLGELFIDTSPSRLEEVYHESDWKTPIIFILSKGADPTNEFLLFKDRFEKIRKEQFEEEQKRLERQRELEKQEALLRAQEEENAEAEEGEEGREKVEGEEGEEHHDEEDKKEEVEQEEEKKEEEKNNQDNNNNINNENGENQNEEGGEGGEGVENEEPVNSYEFQTIIISLGQGQEEEAKRAILNDGIKNGSWVLLQNCHLFTSFMPDLATIVQSLSQDYTDIPNEIIPTNSNNTNTNKHDKHDKHDKHEKDKIQVQDNLVNPNFRLWLTSMPVSTFPVSILQNSLKLTTEPPSGIKSNMKKLFDDLTDDKTEPITKPVDPTNKTPDEIKKEEEQIAKDNKIKKQHFTKILYSLSLFHAVLQERKKFGPIGFNIRYDFNQSDFDTSSQLVNIYLSEADVDYVPWDSILYLIGEVTYGGSITDETDRIVMNSTLLKFINENLFEKEKDANGNDTDVEMKFVFGKYEIPAYTSLEPYQKYINTLPSFDDPDIFGLNDNANIVYELKESSALLGNLTNVLPKELSSKKPGAKSSNEIVLEIISNIAAEQFEEIDKKSRNKIHDKIYDNDLKHPLTIVLFQEIDKYNNLIVRIEATLKELKSAIEGTSIMSNESDEIYHSLLINKIPLAWMKIAYSSFKSFGSWISDLKKRIEFIQQWLVNGHPIVYWMSGLFYPQGFITGVYQNHARETKIPVSDITMKFTVMNMTKDEIQKGPKYGIYVEGLFLEGASWDEKIGLIDQKPGDMRFNMPVIWFETIKEVKQVKDDDDEDENENEIYYYLCPMFKTGKRSSIIASSGNSLEKVLDVELPSKENKDYWILRGAALLMQLDD